jgi:hypothetical protein
MVQHPIHPAFDKLCFFGLDIYIYIQVQISIKYPNYGIKSKNTRSLKKKKKKKSSNTTPKSLNSKHNTSPILKTLSPYKLNSLHSYPLQLKLKTHPLNQNSIPKLKSKIT